MERLKLDSEIKRRILRSSAMYGLFASILVWVIYFNDFTVGDFGNFLPYFPEQMANSSISIILFPLLVSVTIFYVASLIGAAFVGTFKELLVGSLYAASFAVFFALFLIQSPGSGILNTAGYLFLAAFIVLLAYNVLATLSRRWKIHAIKALAASALIYVEGQVVVRLVSLVVLSSGMALPGGLETVLTELLELGFLVAAVVSLLGVFKTSTNPYLSTVGGIASSYVLIVAASLFGSLYFNFFRGKISTISPGIANLSPFIEWTGICIVAAIIFTRARKGMQASMMAEAELGDWIKHVQQITTYKGDRFVGFTETIYDFLERGQREKFIIRLAMILRDNNLREDEIAVLLRDIIYYEDAKGPFFSLRGRAYAQERENEIRRKEALIKTIRKIAPYGLGRAIDREAEAEKKAETKPEAEVVEPLVDGKSLRERAQESEPEIEPKVDVLNLEGVHDES